MQGWGLGGPRRDRRTAGNYGSEVERFAAGGGSPGATPDLPQPNSYAASFIAPLMISDALFAAACNVLVERCAYRSVTFELECPRIC